MPRTLRSHLNVFPPPIKAREVRTLLLHRKIPCQIVQGWSLATYDNHDRSKVLLQGERLLKIENITHIPARVHHILSRTLTAEDALNALYTLPPTFTIDFHLINLVCAELILPFRFNPLNFHPFIRFSQLSSETLDRTHTGLFVHTHDISSHLEEKLSSVISTGI
jgi:hypothetical protein